METIIENETMANQEDDAKGPKKSKNCVGDPTKHPLKATATVLSETQEADAVVEALASVAVTEEENDEKEMPDCDLEQVAGDRHEDMSSDKLRHFMAALEDDDEVGHKDDEFENKQPIETDKPKSEDMFFEGIKLLELRNAFRKSIWRFMQKSFSVN